MNNLRRRLSVNRILVFLLAVVGACQIARAQGQVISFSATGDVPYGSDEVSTFKKQITNHNKYSPSAFFVHVGDIIAGSESCDESKYSRLASDMKALAAPAYIVTGDNETIDCKSSSQGMGYFLKHFKNYEQNFCAAPNTERQSSRPENWAFTMDGVLFIGVNMVYGSNANKQAADWVKQQMEENGSQVRASAVFSHFSPNSSSSFSTPFRKAAAAFGKPVIFVHGHGHSWSTDYPFPEKNIFKVQVNKGGSEDPVEITVTLNTSSPEKAFILKRKPWSGKNYINMPPCANAGPDQTLNASLSTTLKGGASDDGDNGSILTTTWSQISGPGTATFGNAHALTTTASFNMPGTYVIQLTADDGQKQKGDEATITVPSTTPVLAISDVNINEGNSGAVDAVFTVSLSGFKGQTVTVDYQIVDGTATNNDDYVANPASGTLTFNNTTPQTITVTINSDTIDDLQNETFFINLMNASAGATIGDDQGVGTIMNDDGPMPPVAPSNLAATATSSSTASITWNDNSTDEDGFKIERKLSGGSFSEIATVGADVTSYDDIELSAGLIYVYRIRAYNGVGHSNYSNEASAATPGGSGGSSDWALNKLVAAFSTYSGKPATNAVDGDADTYWRSGDVSSSKSNAWLQVDLGAAMTVGRVVLKWKENYFAKTYEIQVSHDEVIWAPVHNAAGKSGTQDFSFSPTAARYVRFYPTQNNKSNYRILAFEVYAGASAMAKRSNEAEEAVAAAAIPDGFVLEQNYPNPFNPGTRISFGLPQASRLTIKVYTINGAEVKTLVDGEYSAGAHAVVFEPKSLPSGAYFYVMQAGEVRLVRRLMLVK